MEVEELLLRLPEEDTDDIFGLPFGDLHLDYWIERTSESPVIKQSFK